MNLTYVHIDEDGNPTTRTAPNWWAALEDVGPEGWARVRLADPQIAAFVNDCGLILPTYRRNIIGSLVLQAFDAPNQPYAGPVVFTGWCPDGDDAEVVDLTGWQRCAVLAMTGVMRLAYGLDGDPQCHCPSRSNAFAELLTDPKWIQITREIAEEIRTAPTPQLTWFSGEQIARYVDGGA